MLSVAVIGSTKYKNEIQEVQKRLCLSGYIVYGIHVFSHADNIAVTPEQKVSLYKNKMAQICSADMVYVVQPEGTPMGEGTKKELSDAKAYNKIILINGQLLME